MVSSARGRRRRQRRHGRREAARTRTQHGARARAPVRRVRVLVVLAQESDELRHDLFLWEDVCACACALPPARADEKEGSVRGAGDAWRAPDLETASAIARTNGTAQADACRRRQPRETRRGVGVFAHSFSSAHGQRAQVKVKNFMFISSSAPLPGSFLWQAANTTGQASFPPPTSTAHTRAHLELKPARLAAAGARRHVARARPPRARRPQRRRAGLPAVAQHLLGRARAARLERLFGACVCLFVRKGRKRTQVQPCPLAQDYARTPL